MPGIDPIYVMSLGMVGVVMAVAAMLFLMFKMWKTLERILVGMEAVSHNTGHLQAVGQQQRQFENPHLATINDILREISSTQDMNPRRAQQLASQLASHSSKLQDEVEEGMATVYMPQAQPQPQYAPPQPPYAPPQYARVGGSRAGTLA